MCLCFVARSCTSQACDTVTSLYNNCFGYQERFPYIELSLIRGTIAVTIQRTVPNHLVLSPRKSLHRVSLQSELTVAFNIRYCTTCRGKVVIIGAGPAGSTSAILLSKRGYDVEVYERRPQPKQDPIDLKRTYIIALTDRGLKALRAANVRIPTDAPYKGFVRHLKGGKIQVQ